METMGSLSCRFVDRRSSRPLPGARIMCVRHDQHLHSLATGETGDCEFVVAEGVYDLIVSAPGYVAALLRGIAVLAGERTLVIRSLDPGTGRGQEEEPSTAVAGFVRDRLGHPLSNVVVQAVSKAKTYAAPTDQHGVYRIHGVPEGEYELFVHGTEGTIAKESLRVVDLKELVRLDFSVA